MKQFSCGLVVPGCTATFRGESEEVILQQVARHAREDHGLETVPPEIESQVRAHLAKA